MRDSEDEEQGQEVDIGSLSPGGQSKQADRKYSAHNRATCLQAISN
ncbi:MAG TPA: hypothetical protein VFU22_20585 [Roseiflexaceae bacterium]|nr:hypothetical protein [Roseiflexaceae bacterium]